MSTLELQKKVPRYRSIRTTISNLRWQLGLSTFFTDKVPFSFSTGTCFASKISTLAHTCHGHWVELGAGTGILSRHILDKLKQDFSEDYANIRISVSDYSESAVASLKNAGLFSEHPNTDFPIINAHAPHFSTKEWPRVVILSYLLDSMDCRHIEINNNTVSEIQVKTRIKTTAPIIDVSVFPPKIRNPEEIKKLFNGKDIHLQKKIAPFLLPYLKESYVKVPLNKTDMSKKEKEDLLSFAKTLPKTTLRFNYSMHFSNMLKELLARDQESLIIINDFGYPLADVAPKVSALSTTYGTVSCHSVYFPYLRHIATDCKATTFTTLNPPGNTQMMVIYKGKREAYIQEQCLSIFKNKEYDTMHTLAKTVFKLKKPTKNTHSHLELQWKNIAPLYKEDYFVTMSFANVAYKNKLYSKAIECLEKILPSYASISIPRLHLLGYCYLENGDFKNAEKAFKKALNLSLDYPVSYLNIAHLYLKKRELESYQKAIKTYIEKADRPSFGEHMITLALLYVQTGDRETSSALTEFICTAYTQDKSLFSESLYRKALGIQNLIAQIQPTT